MRGSCDSDRNFVVSTPHHILLGWKNKEKMRRAGHVVDGYLPVYRGLVCNGGVYRVLVGKPKGKRPLGKPRRRWEDDIKMDL